MATIFLASWITTVANGATPAPVIAQISAGDAHTCVVTGAGGVKCWGSNRFGQLGNGASRPCSESGRCLQRFSRTAVDVVGLESRVEAIAAGASHTCALTSVGGVKCWGYNASGQLGNGQKTCKAFLTCSKNASSTPVDVVGLTRGVSAIAAGEFHTCAITNSGGVKCWGSQSSGELGNGTGDSSSVPVDVVGLTGGVSAIAAGAHVSCAVASGGTAQCWGGSPRSVAGLPGGVTAIAMGGTSAGATSAHACALTSAGAIKCWGDNVNGQLGNGSLKNSSTPVDVVGLATGVRAITASATHTCALTSRGGAKCWGSGVLGNGSTTGSNTPVDVVGLASGVKAIAAGGSFTCALPSVGGVKCWGYSQQGRLGNGSSTAKPSTTPVDVRFSSGPSETPTTKASGGTPGCSKAEATAVVKRLHLGEADFIPNPVWKVICGAVMGPGSQTMVVSLATGGSSVPFGGWAVFRMSNGKWQLVMQRHNGAQIGPAGSDIRDTVSILRPGDSRCCPTGGTRSRIWHWNGTRFVTGPWKQSSPATAPKVGTAPDSGHFKTPSGNVVCQYFLDWRVTNGTSRSVVHCGIHSGLEPAPPRRPCDEGGYAGDRVSLETTGRVDVPPCAGDPGAFVGEEAARVLAYGTTWTGGGLRCTSAVTGLTCRNTSGHGFFLSREHWRQF